MLMLIKNLSIFLLIIVTVINGLIYPIRNNYKEALDYVPPEQEITFHLYHSSDLSINDQLITKDEASIKNSRLDPNLPIKIIIHGWTHFKDVPWLIEMRETMAKTNLWNIIVVDWSPLSHAIYTEARIHTSVVGRQVARFCKYLSEAVEMKISDMHLIGHSMGAQIAAYAGHKIQVEIKQAFGRITGLDPAAPLYEWPHVESLDEVIDPSDAQFVDIIHTNGKHLGIIFPSGHVDYYPNGGQRQPGCQFWICSHLRSCEFWTISIKNPNFFKAYSFNSWDEYLNGKNENLHPVPMGISASEKIPFGSYFLETNGNEKYFLNTTTTILDSFKPKSVVKDNKSKIYL